MNENLYKKLFIFNASSGEKSFDCMSFYLARFEVIGRHALSVILSFKMANQAITL
jgi:hypothetical protein